MSALPAVRRAANTDVPELARVLARAFYDDPVACWSCRPDRMRHWMLERFNATRLRQLLSDEEIWTNEQRTSVASWAPPKRWGTTLGEDLALARPLLHPRLIARMPLVVRGMVGLERSHPRAALEVEHAALAGIDSLSPPPETTRSARPGDDSLSRPPAARAAAR